MTAAAIWVLLTIIGELFFLQMDIFGEPVTKQAHFIDEAFILLMVLAIPIFTFVITMILYVVFKFRAKGDDLEDAAPVRTHKKWVGFWLAWTTILCLVVIVHPGYTGIIELRETNEEEPDLTVNVTGRRWQWLYEYEGRDVSLYSKDDMLVLPNDSLIRFIITAEDQDVVHSFWIPAFRMKIDAVPGLTTYFDVNTTHTGHFNDDVNFRVQCAELCGLDHSLMFTRIEVVEPAEFEQWIADEAA
ncbi:cytochrome c oxidase subunit II [Candidatus Lucifugimonas marina]|uniref:cytochrome-c oxidase n=1 Tax=Candidatus Lucifugimonas marina TaxID=3038979 RepID=A0AAJ5ZHJ9_9CHLR|nr:cytochrome c oxidase subunit II [SAR202 cluster bacterium JH702]MDG0869558.1 cytochrome c oxidase subunit II [SAR202 cluster bacterium JH639]WFG34294.1 cytochrome c oxidase subunit II [SAR202 cluster bacterium JH545]WFG38223.1 cytochrome c oxidase subunit II [SAR202 cluster bacterium JH1073]